MKPTKREIIMLVNKATRVLSVYGTLLTVYRDTISLPFLWGGIGAMLPEGWGVGGVIELDSERVKFEVTHGGEAKYWLTLDLRAGWCRTTTAEEAAVREGDWKGGK